MLINMLAYFVESGFLYEAINMFARLYCCSKIIRGGLENGKEKLPRSSRTNFTTSW